ncbi:MAG: SIS domain-containing protein [Erysipelotrichaceae bacterium]|nr:SIS domain-containing protein [Erysipelotrichaceae bacterium]
MAEVLSMIGHIRDIPRVLKKAYDNQDLYIPEMVDLFTKNNIKKVYFLGSGTSHNASLVMRNFFTDIVKVEAYAPEPNVFTYHENTNPAGVYENSQIAVFGLTQHGDSISTCDAISKANDLGHVTVGVTESLGSPVTQLANYTVHLLCEREEIGPETRGYSETLFQFYLIAIRVARTLGRISEEEYQKYDADARKLIEDMPVVIEESEAWVNKNMDEFLNMQKSSICGYGQNWPTAQEGRLKFFETYRKPCMYYEQEEQLHGPLRAYGPDNYIFMIASEGGFELNRAIEVAAYYRRVFSEHVFVTTCEDIEVTEKDLKYSVKTNDLLSTIVYVTPYQVLSALLCDAAGIDTIVSPIKDRSISGHMPRKD